MLNIVAINGRLVADPEIRVTNSGVSVCTVTIAVERNFTNNGERVCDFIDVVLWKQNAEFLSKYFKKGTMVAINGTIQTRLYEDKNGTKHKVTEIVAENVNFCGSRTENEKTDYEKNKLIDKAQDFNEQPDEDELPF